MQECVCDPCCVHVQMLFSCVWDERLSKPVTNENKTRSGAVCAAQFPVHSSPCHCVIFSAGLKTAVDRSVLPPLQILLLQNKNNAITLYFVLCFKLSGPVSVENLIMQGPAQVFETSIIQETFRVCFQPHAQLLNARHSDFSQPVPVAVHKHTTEGSVLHGGKLHSFLLQLETDA